MSKIAVITMGVRLQGEKGYTRFRSLCEYLVQAGHTVTLLTTTFQHWEKAQRDVASIHKEAYPFAIQFFYEPGYRKNIDLQRIKSHRIAAKNLRTLLEEKGDYDLLYAEIPPNDVALAAASYAKEKGIPFVADVNDLWPEAMRMVLDIPVISSLLFRPLLRDAEKVYGLASGIVGTSDEYRDRPILHQKRDIPRETVYVGLELSAFDAGVETYQKEVYKEEGEYWVTYAGTIGTSYDIETLLLAAEELTRRGHRHLRIKILGNGPLQDKLLKMANEKEIYNVEFLGYMPYGKMAAYLAQSDILVNSFVKKAPQSIVTKIGDYLAAGKAMINTCMSREFQEKVERDGFGVNVVPEDRMALADAIEDLLENDEKRRTMGIRARQVAVEEFDRPKSYRRIIHLLEELLQTTADRT